MNKVIFIDMDGVMCDFMTPALRLNGLNPEDRCIHEAVMADYDAIKKMHPQGLDAFYKAIQDAGEDFWANLEPMPWAEHLIQLCEVYSDRLCFLTACEKFYDAPKGKMLWVKKHYPDMPLIFANHKDLIASPDKFLIDDSPFNYFSFLDAGGFAHRFACQYGLPTEKQWTAELNVIANKLHVWRQT